jgi:hypothetical protein
VGAFAFSPFAFAISIVLCIVSDNNEVLNQPMLKIIRGALLGREARAPLRNTEEACVLCRLVECNLPPCLQKTRRELAWDSAFLLSYSVFASTSSSRGTLDKSTASTQVKKTKKI